MNRAMAYFLWASFCIGLTIMVVFQSTAMFGSGARLDQIAGYMIYSLTYTISKNHIVGFFVLVISQLTILVTHFFLQFMCDIDISKYLLNFLFPIIVILAAEIMQILVLKKREWY